MTKLEEAVLAAESVLMGRAMESRLVGYHNEVARECTMAVLRAIRTPDMEMARRVGAETGLGGAAVDLAWVRMVEALAAEGQP